MIVNDIDRLETLCRELQASGGKIVFTNGVFDLMHVGHLRYLRQARELGTALLVAVNSDATVTRLKGPTRPIVCEADRQEMLDGLRCVDYVTRFDTDTPVPLVAKLRPDIYAKGGDYTVATLPEAPVVLGYGGEVAILQFVDGQSTSGIVKRILLGGPERNI